MKTNVMRRRRFRCRNTSAERLLCKGLIGAFVACTISASAWAFIDPTTNLPEFREPPEIRFGPGRPVRLRAIYDDRVEEIQRRNLDGSTEVLSRSVIRQSFGYSFPSGTIRVNPGETLPVSFTNNLKLEAAARRTKDSDATYEFLKKQANITNLHTHGLHVSPQEYSDNVLLHVNEGKRVSYAIKLPGDHAPGTHWYHSHVHGSTSLQVQNGMLGALIVEEPEDERLTPPEYFDSTVEKVVVISQATDKPNPNPQDQFTPCIKRDPAENLDPEIAALLTSQAVRSKSSPLSPQLQKLVDVENAQQFDAFVQELNQQGGMGALMDALHNLRPQEPTFMVNGQLNPVLELMLDDIFRLRIVNAGANNRDYKKLYIQKKGAESVPMYLAAMDGINLTHLPTVDGVDGNYIAYTKGAPLELAPSNRADVYFMADGDGDYELKHGDQVLLTVEVNAPDFLIRRVDPAAYAKRLQKFLDALDRNLKELQDTAPYAKRGYLHRFYTGPNERLPDTKPAITRNMNFDVRGRGAESDGPPNGRKFTINGRDYNEMVPVGPRIAGGKMEMQGKRDYLGKHKDDGGLGPDGETHWPIREGTVEEWVITNTTPSYGQDNADGRHPFHIHVNPFWVVDIKERGETKSVRQKNPYDPRLNRWQDTINIPGGGSVTIRHRFSEFVGLFVLHCHILRHEDRGMMINVLIVPNKEPDAAAYFKKQTDRNKEINDEINNPR